MKRAIYPGSFDPPTLAHLEILIQAQLIFDEVIVLVAQNGGKEKGLLSPEERVAAWKTMTKSPVGILDKDDTILDVLGGYEANWVVRGHRGPSDFEGEMAYADFIRRCGGDESPEMVYFMVPPIMTTISSSAVRAMVGLNGWKLNTVMGKYISSDVRDIIEQKIG